MGVQKVLVDRFCSVEVFCVDLGIIKIKVMDMKMVMLKHRFDYVQEVMGDRVVVNKEEKDDRGDEWVYFNININASYDMLDFFHAGIRCGFDSRGGKLF